MNEQLIKEMKERVFAANLALPDAGLVKLTWGNVSEIDRETGIVVIKPSGVPYGQMKADDMVVTDLEGHVLAGALKPSSDLETHLELYKAFKEINSVVHTHSKNAVMWAQAGRGIPAYGTTHADTFYGVVPCTRQLTSKEVESAYELETGKVIIETFTKEKIDPMAVPGVLVYGHGPFTWGKTPQKAVENSIVLDEIAEMAEVTEIVNKNILPIPQYLLDKHYFRKHGVNAYYGQG
ncbi:L-ribulose-5-phosphate 4-epimerase [Enterococcus sp. DIV0242_7C1]|uniref:L-ribulose-5-phosphate 4-epimerase n=1 Tax=Candidatus Enterococcus dunnyi TaxID=1834192 RepID=A0A200J8A3_9ENTE|nr:MULTISPECIES: L-ribulose-5-phosphate 4-epimerase [unclassified Enterococcus]MBO0470958.1 L-ribulose-5-phosphate 4-epimerase [Enterococcus sp. DIV0242_7C1]MCA5013196.1 L-ribulose-5-phosphate 4-epimerase [Enterococcus sp. S23]MCA5016446.1 L-ribulose-5-phosphate 4-epimerase [Enterococcus sp. S22(2020)]OUZ33408.1 L-ribulose-5-phosphate 4-epimerase [Enterococcus sp. 9D6_DIV0238]